MNIHINKLLSKSSPEQQIKHFVLKIWLDTFLMETSRIEKFQKIIDVNMYCFLGVNE